MSFDVARSCVQKEMEFVRQSDKYDELEIDFMGGEPFSNFTLIRQVVEWLESETQPVPWVTFATTNGTLIRGAVQEWVNVHKNSLCLGLSYDGNAGMQASNRGTGPLDLAWYAGNWPTQGVRMTVSKETLPFLFDGVKDVWRHGVVCVPALAHGVAWDEKDSEILNDELEKLESACLRDELPISCMGMLTRSLYGIVSKERQKRFCGSGRGMVAYDVDGTPYPCHMFSPIVLGYTSALDVSVADVCKDGDLRDGRCSSCSIENWCPTCYGFNYRIRGDVRKRDHSWCRMMEVIVRASCRFQIRYYAKHKKRIRPGDIRQLKSATAVYHLLQSTGFQVGEKRT